MLIELDLHGSQVENRFKKTTKTAWEGKESGNRKVRKVKELWKVWKVGQVEKVRKVKKLRLLITKKCLGTQLQK